VIERSFLRIGSPPVTGAGFVLPHAGTPIRPATPAGQRGCFALASSQYRCADTNEDLLITDVFEYKMRDMLFYMKYTYILHLLTPLFLLFIFFLLQGDSPDAHTCR